MYLCVLVCHIKNCLQGIHCSDILKVTTPLCVCVCVALDKPLTGANLNLQLTLKSLCLCVFVAHSSALSSGRRVLVLFR